MIEDLAGESWLPVEGFKGLYEVSNKGRVKRLRRVVEVSRGYANEKPKWVYDEKIMAGSIRGKGYVMVVLRGMDTSVKPKQVFVHRLVAQAFIKNRHGHPHIDHINNVKGDNRVENLEWVTPQENIRRAAACGLMGGGARGEKHWSAKLTEAQVAEIRALKDEKVFGDGGSKEIGKKYGVHHSVVCKIWNNQIWRPKGVKRPVAAVYECEKWLNEENVRKMRMLWASRWSFEEIGRVVALSPSLVSKVCRRKLWADFEPEESVRRFGTMRLRNGVIERPSTEILF